VSPAELKGHAQILSQKRALPASGQEAPALDVAMKYLLLVILAALLIFLANQLYQQFFLGRY
jgi:hypothetical protein